MVFSFMTTWRVLVTALVLSSEAMAQGLNSSVLDMVRANVNSSSTTSWEMGTATEAILENDLRLSINSILYFARNALRQRNQSLAIIEDTSAGDPASLGVAVILGNLTGADTGIPNVTFASAAWEQVQYLLTEVPRAPNGAISHRVNECWDFVYMCPPFFAYYGVVTNNRSLVQEAYRQILLYRDVLKRPSGLWQHIALGEEIDTGNWSTGNAWAAAGIVRVLATIQNSQFSGEMQSQREDLTSWAEEIFDAFYPYQDSSTSLSRNYVDDNTSFLEASGSVLMASAVYRLAILSKSYGHVQNAEHLRSSNSPGGHIDVEGWLYPVLGSRSPEGESFVLLLNAAYGDWVKAGSEGAKSGAAVRSRGGREMRKLSAGYAAMSFVVGMMIASGFLF
ncbi:Six-hairpin glycosidase-like protein [Cantharellus anzutake]|uniref:Six-hairpin glycosidase-like protein n=1 Tax=Cantharellus anzutake TaxID=1750568 RepID=UPI0019085290|nr:Six-hairpin glycosidase-like protein [Cantharellus anzutake]KAF8337494.1 Six-hairpin glycosidase-like protein [Cantharellus anzutake]